MADDQRDAVTLSLEGPQLQRRWTLALRVILAIPHFFWFALVAFVATFAVFFAWFGALFTGRMPTGLGGFIERVVRYQARLNGYMYLLTDVYPPFSLSPDVYPVEVHIDQPDRLNRWAVLFRFILVIPTWIVSSLASGGATVVLFFLWIITLVSGRMPDSAFEALAVTLRYQLRAYSYTWMLTSQYPGGLFGDRARAEPEPLDLDVAPPAPELGGQPRVTRFVLSKAAKRLVILFLVLGLFTNGTSARRFSEFSDRADAADALRDERDQLDTALDTFFLVDAVTCAGSGDVSCLRNATGRLIGALQDFQRDLRDIDVPSNADDDVAVVDTDVTEVIGVLQQMQETPGGAPYAEAVSRLNGALSRFDDDYDRLYDEALFG